MGFGFKIFTDDKDKDKEERMVPKEWAKENSREKFAQQFDESAAPSKEDKWKDYFKKNRKSSEK